METYSAQEREKKTIQMCARVQKPPNRKTNEERKEKRERKRALQTARRVEEEPGERAKRAESREPFKTSHSHVEFQSDRTLFVL